MRIFLAGEGVGELGRWGEPPEYRSGSPRSNGVLYALVSCVRGDDLEIAGAIRWCEIRKYRSGDHAKPEERVVLGAALAALEKRVEVLVFSRDSDGDGERSRRVADAPRRLASMPEFDRIKVVGGTAEPCLEAWILVIAGIDPRAESRSKQRVLALAEESGLDTEQTMVDAIREEALGAVPAESISLRPWLDRARAVFAPQ